MSNEGEWMGTRMLKAAIAVAALAIGVAAALALTPSHSSSPAAAPVSHQRAALLGQFSGQIISFSDGDMLNSPNFNYGTTLTDDTTGSGRTVCVPGRIQDPLDTIRLCGTNAPTDRCVAADPNGTGTFVLTIAHCNAVGTLWDQIVSPGGCPQVQFQNHHYAGRAIAFDGHNGDAVIARVPPIPGWFYNMFAVPLC
jgi:hypothetical protein